MALPATPFVLATLWLTFQHKPDWYRPVALDETGLRRARSKATTIVDDVSDRIVQGEGFDFVLREQVVNEWLAGLEGLWPEAGRLIPHQLGDPAIAFDTDRVRLGALYTTERWRAIIHVVLSVRLSDQGRYVEITLIGARGGSLPVPRAALRKLLTPLLKRARHPRLEETPSPSGSTRAFRPSHGDEREATSPLHAVWRDLQSVDDLFDGVKVRNRFVWPNGDRPFAIDSITINNGVLRLGVRPL